MSKNSTKKEQQTIDEITHQLEKFNSQENTSLSKEKSYLYSISKIIKSKEQNFAKPPYVYKDGKPFENEYSNQFFMGHFSQISFVTTGCKIGQCSFCNYGAGTKDLTPEIVANEMKKYKEAILTNPEDTYAVLLDCVGSILDKNEFSSECLDSAIAGLEDILSVYNKIESVSFETHYQTIGAYENGEYVASESIQKIINFKQAHPEISTLIIELGFESSNNEIRNKLLFKPIDDKAYKQCVQLLHDNGIEVEANIMATAPFLTEQEQVAQSTKSIIDALTPIKQGGYGIDSITLFPLNVRKNTFCEYVFSSQNEINRIEGSQSPDWMKQDFPIWSMVRTLDLLIQTGNADMLSKVSVAWFGGREITGDEKYPQDWEKTYDYFVRYRSATSANERTQIVQEMTNFPEYQEFLNSLENVQGQSTSVDDPVRYMYNMIKKSGLPMGSKCLCPASSQTEPAR